MRIVVDAMGGDHAPANVVAGVVAAVKEFPVTITLVGMGDRVKTELSKYSYPDNKIEILHASEVVDMDDNPMDVIRKKKDSSIAVGINLLKQPGYDAFVSAGNTGAVVAAATLYLRMIEGVDRPGIGLVIPQVNGYAFLIDVGANAEPKPEHLCQYGHMARAYMRGVMGVQNPTVGLVNIGQEEGKGSGFDKQAYQLLQEKVPNFVGNVEPNQVFTNKADCIVCSGFVGNVIIKMSEGLMESAATVLKREIKKNPFAVLGAFLMMGALKGVKKHADYSEYGGAPLLGVNGIVMKSHGRSSPKAIKNAIRATMREVEHNILEEMKTAVVS
ncbi:MAG: phosphate acyltransferase PlsX [Candidatus Omnitrophica bacterium]|nr:phosphate acyltransferase PlsX [Candidatus Omnitrophota bacterium]